MGLYTVNRIIDGRLPEEYENQICLNNDHHGKNINQALRVMIRQAGQDYLKGAKIYYRKNPNNADRPTNACWVNKGDIMRFFPMMLITIVSR